MHRRLLASIFLTGTLVLFSGGMNAAGQVEPGKRTTVDAHNCYPYAGQWSDRIERALATGTPIAIEQDLFWYQDPKTQAARSVLAHARPLTGNEPEMKEYFFERVRPIVELALKENKRETWPIITLNLDVKTDEPDHIHAIYQLLLEYKSWLTTAIRGTDESKVEPWKLGPILVLAGESDVQQETFYNQVSVGGDILAFGAIHSDAAKLSMQTIVEPPAQRTNYRRWWNNPWTVIEPEGQSHATEWTKTKEERLNAMAESAHRAKLFLRFYTLDGATPEEQEQQGLFRQYNFFSLEEARKRWIAAARAHVDYIATDQYELLRQTLLSFH